uniref:Uncharacterized protein n=1 Tax=Anguilla anguilla TaxID=7936 RepID=A0A0E9U753_ANGAN
MCGHACIKSKREGAERITFDDHKLRGLFLIIHPVSLFS